MLYISDIYDANTGQHLSSVRYSFLHKQVDIIYTICDLVTDKVIGKYKMDNLYEAEELIGYVRCTQDDYIMMKCNKDFLNLLNYIDVEEDFEHTSFELSVKYNRQVYPLDFVKGVDNLGLCLYEASLHPSRVSGSPVNIVDVIVQYNQRHPEYDLLHSRDFYFSYENTKIMGKKIYHITFDKDLSIELTKYAIKWRLV